MGDHFHLFRYNPETDEYLEAFWGAMEKYRYIMLHFTEPAMLFQILVPFCNWRLIVSIITLENYCKYETLSPIYGIIGVTSIGGRREAY